MTSEVGKASKNLNTLSIRYSFDTGSPIKRAQKPAYRDSHWLREGRFKHQIMIVMDYKPLSKILKSMNLY